ncbi:MAG: FAD-binding domain-containing protein, partial [Chromatiaceae bacterium]
HLHFGEISPRQVWQAVRGVQATEAATTRGGDAFLRELGWREFCHHLLHHWPELPEQPFNPRFADFPWRDDGEAFRAWTRGQTGYPLVDAGMRELWHTGWMHNRVRMVTASFLVKHLLVPWQQGQDWFWDTLVDANLANNAGGWQWVAGCGADAAPYFRIFNPVLQGQKFDPHGDYARRWLPELSRLSDKDIYAPFAANKASLAAAGVRLGVDYPEPLVEHDFARRRALGALAILKSN